MDALRDVPVCIPDDPYWRRLINCQDACPVHTDARGYIRAIGEGDDERAYRIARGPNPLASICGRICGAPCEAACRRGTLDAPIAIRPLKRFVTERFGPEAHPDRPGAIVDAVRGTATPNAGAEELAHLLHGQTKGRFPKAGGEQVAVIGSGPAGLACAHDLALMGFSVVVFEMESIPGGMLALGIPEYRLPRNLIRAEIAVIEHLGVQFRCGVQVGPDVSFPELRRTFSAVVIAVGAKRSRWLNLPGARAQGILGGVDFLRAAALGHSTELGRRVVVIGGGNVAYDVGRTVLRQEQIDVSRVALRRGARDVRLCCLESVEEMPAEDVEILEGAEEGIALHPSLGPIEFVQDEEGRVRGVVFQRCVSVYDEQKRFAPVFDPSQRTMIEADSVLLSVGQAPDLSFLDPSRDGVEIDSRGWPRCDATTLATTADGIFLAGDLAYGTKLLIHAVASGKEAARSVYRRCTGRTLTPEVLQFHIEAPHFDRAEGYERLSRTHVPTVGVEPRLADARCPVELGYDEEEARREATRCLDCGVNTIFDSELCVLCGGCADVCPVQCLRLVPVESLDGEAMATLLAARYTPEERAGGSAIVKDETTCIRCALCARRCPVGAITMERLNFSTEWVEAAP